MSDHLATIIEQLENALAGLYALSDDVTDAYEDDENILDLTSACAHLTALIAYLESLT